MRKMTSLHKMSAAILSLLIFVFTIRSAISDDECTFRAAVYESEFTFSDADPIVTMSRNLDTFQAQVELAAKDAADIIVFPEMGIVGLDWDSSKDLYYQQVSDPGTNPCAKGQVTNETLAPYSLSCMARDNSIIVVANFASSVLCDVGVDPSCPGRGSYHFNTDAAFDADGILLAVYHKVNLYGEPEFDPPPKGELVYFDAPFGRIGLITCFDILWLDPTVHLVEQYRVDSIAFPTAWMDQLPYLASIQAQAAWAAGLGVNLLAANMHLPIGGFMGSGLFAGLRGPVNYVYSTDATGRLIVDNLPCKPSTNQNATVSETNPDDKILAGHQLIDLDLHYIKYEDTSEFVGAVIAAEDVELRLCQGSLCCDVAYQLSDYSAAGRYMLVVHRGNVSEGDLYTYGAEICSVLWCDDGRLNGCTRQPAVDAPEAFATLQLWGNFSTPYIYPSILTDDLQLATPNRWNYDSRSDKCEKSAGNGTCASITSTGDPLRVTAISLYGRLYDLDAL